MPHDQEINCFSDLEKDALDNSNRLIRISATEYPSANKVEDIPLPSYETEIRTSIQNFDDEDDIKTIDDLVRRADLCIQSSDYDGATVNLYNAVGKAIYEFWHNYRIVAVSVDALLVFRDVMEDWSRDPDKFRRSWTALSIVVNSWDTYYWFEGYIDEKCKAASFLLTDIQQMNQSMRLKSTDLQRILIQASKNCKISIKNSFGHLAVVPEIDFLAHIEKNNFIYVE